MNFFSSLSSVKLKKTPSRVAEEDTPEYGTSANLLDQNPSINDDSSPLPPGIRIVIISDTHGRHEGLEKTLPPADVVIHAGDFTNTGTISDVTSFTTWFDSLPYDHRVYIAGNHDTSLDTEYYLDRGHARFHCYGNENKPNAKTPEEISTHCVNLVRNTTSTYLQDEEVSLDVNIKASSDDKNTPSSDVDPYPLRVYGSPWSPEFSDWAFNLDRGQPCLEKWNLIPDHTEVLITHGPPLGYGDRTTSGFRCGCEDLLATIRNKATPPRVHIFGHIHEDRGAWHDGKTLYVNGSTCTFQYRPTNPAIVVHLPLDPNLPASIVLPSEEVNDLDKE